MMSRECHALSVFAALVEYSCADVSWVDGHACGQAVALISDLDSDLLITDFISAYHDTVYMAFPTQKLH